MMFCKALSITRKRAVTIFLSQSNWQLWDWPNMLRLLSIVLKHSHVVQDLFFCSALCQSRSCKNSNSLINVNTCNDHKKPHQLKWLMFVFLQMCAFDKPEDAPRNRGASEKKGGMKHWQPNTSNKASMLTMVDCHYVCRMHGSELIVGIVVLYHVRDEVLRSQRSRGRFAPTKVSPSWRSRRASAESASGDDTKSLLGQYAYT